MTSRPPGRDPDDPRDRNLSRRSKVTSTGPWVWVVLIALLGIAAYVLAGF